MNKKTILVIGAHRDDCEIGAGGLILKAVKKGHRVILLVVCGYESNWVVIKGREKEFREKTLQKAKEMGVEKRFLNYGGCRITIDMEIVEEVAKVVADVKPDVVLFHNPFETSPYDHGIVGKIAEYAARFYYEILGIKSLHCCHEMYSYEVYLRPSPPYPLFQPDTYIDISDVIKEVVDIPNYFTQLYAESEEYKGAGGVNSKVKIDYLGEEEIPLYSYGEMKLTLSRYRGFQCGVRYAEAYKAMDRSPLGKRILLEIL